MELSNRHPKKITKGRGQGQIKVKP